MKGICGRGHITHNNWSRCYTQMGETHRAEMAGSAKALADTGKMVRKPKRGEGGGHDVQRPANWRPLSPTLTSTRAVP